MDNVGNDEKIRAISERIKQLRIDAGYTSYEKFSLDHGLEGKQYWRLESGKNFTIQTLLKITDIHKTTLEEFFKGL